MPTVIGKDAVIKGELSSDTDMLIRGRVEGKIRGANQVVVGEDGDVQAEVEAKVIIVHGRVKGDCRGSQKVEITATGKVLGNISARAIVVAEGATFRGSSKMATDAPKKPAESKESVSPPASASSNPPPPTPSPS